MTETSQAPLAVLPVSMFSRESVKRSDEQKGCCRRGGGQAGPVKARFIVVFLVIAGALLALALTVGGARPDAVVVVDASEVVAHASSYQQRELRVRGFVKGGSILRQGDRADFVVTLNGSDIPVRYDGNTQLPDTFNDGAAVRVDGMLDEQGRLVSHKVEAKCASKYSAEHAERLQQTGYDAASVPAQSY